MDAQFHSKFHKLIILFTMVQSSTQGSTGGRGPYPNSFLTCPYTISPFLATTLSHLKTWTLDTHPCPSLSPANLYHLVTQYKTWVSSLSSHVLWHARCIVKITGEMVLSFPAGITRHFANNPSPAALTFRVINFSRLEHVLPNPQLLCW